MTRCPTNFGWVPNKNRNQPNMSTYPFGQPLTPIAQTDRSPKRLFALGV